MAVGDVSSVELGGTSDLHYVDTGMYDVAGYGSVYLLDAERPALIDSGIGTDRERVLAALAELGIDRGELAVIALTHVHLDHAGGAGFLAAACPNATVYVHRIGAPHLVDPARLVQGTKRAVGDQWRHYVDPRPVPADRIRELEDGDRLDLGDRRLEVHHTPGHARHQVVFHNPDDGVVFTGDAAGISPPGRKIVVPTTPPPEFDLEQCLADVEAIAGLDPAALCYAHFGPAQTGDRLEAYGRTLTEWVDAVEATREHLDDDAVVDRLVEETALEGVWSPEKARAEVAMNVRGVLGYLDRRS